MIYDLGNKEIFPVLFLSFTDDQKKIFSASAKKENMYFIIELLKIES